MKVVLLRMKGTLQSYGAYPDINHRLTMAYPSKSSVIGMICSAGGISRDDEKIIAKLSSLKMVVKIVKPGSPLVDEQNFGATWGNETPTVPQANGDSLGKPLQSWKHYVCGALYVVGLLGDDDVIDHVEEWLKSPTRPLFFGRKCCYPSTQILVGSRDCSDDEFIDAVATCPSYDGAFSEPEKVTMVTEQAYSDKTKMIIHKHRDVPTRYSHRSRSYRDRYVAIEEIDNPLLPEKEENDAVHDEAQV